MTIENTIKDNREAKIRHLKNIRERYRKYMKQMPNPPKSVKEGALFSEQLVQLATWENINSKHE